MASAILGWAFVAATLAAFVALLRAGFWRRFPAFCGLLLLQAWQGATVNLADLPSQSWWLSRWMPVERVLLICAVLSAIEVLIRVTREMESVERWGIRVSMLLPIAIAKWMARPVEADPLTVFLRFREDIWIALCLGMLMLLILLLKPLPLASSLRWHLALFATLMASHAFIAPLLRASHLDWVKERAAFQAIAAACCVAWAAFVARKS